MTSSQNICCGCNVFNLGKMLTGIEIILSIIIFIVVMILMGASFLPQEYSKVIGGFLIIWTILILEYVGIHRKINGIIIFNLVIRVISTTLEVIGHCYCTYQPIFTHTLHRSHLNEGCTHAFEM